MTEAPPDVSELAKKSSVAWISVGPHTFPVWHEWVDAPEGGALCVVGSVGTGSEQPIPDVPDGTVVAVSLRSKADRALAATILARVEIVGEGSAAWGTITSALKAGRLNAPDLPTMVDRWARECRVLRLVPVASTAPAPAEIPRTRPRLS